MAAFIHPINWVRQTLKLWRDQARETQAQSSYSQCDLADDVASDDLYNERNTQLWYLPPPC